jgi:site-specific recombinase XerD
MLQNLQIHLKEKLFESKKSQNTIKLYMHICENFLKHFKNDISSLTEKDIERYFELKKFSERNRNLEISALKFLFGIAGKNLDLKRPSNKLQKDKVQILTIEEIKTILNTEIDPQNKLLFMLVYHGIKIKTAKNFKKEYIDSHKIPNSILTYIKKRPYLQNSEFILKFSAKKAEQVFQKALIKANIKKKLKLKHLKISSIVHLLDRGISFKVIRTLHGLFNNLVIKQCESLTEKQNQRILSPVDYLYFRVG